MVPSIKVARRGRIGSRVRAAAAGGEDRVAQPSFHGVPRGMPVRRSPPDRSTLGIGAVEHALLVERQRFDVRRSSADRIRPARLRAPAPPPGPTEGPPSPQRRRASVDRRLVARDRARVGEERLRIAQRPARALATMESRTSWRRSSHSSGKSRPGAVAGSRHPLPVHLEKRRAVRRGAGGRGPRPGPRARPASPSIVRNGRAACTRPPRTIRSAPSRRPSPRGGRHR